MLSTRSSKRIVSAVNARRKGPTVQDPSALYVSAAVVLLFMRLPKQPKAASVWLLLRILAAEAGAARVYDVKTADLIHPSTENLSFRLARH